MTIAGPVNELAPLNEPPFSDVLKKLEELMSQGNRAFLLGAGCSFCAGLPLTSQLTAEVLSATTLDSKTKEILEALKKHFAGSATATIEDFMSELVDLLAIAQRRADRGATHATVDFDGKVYSSTELDNALGDIKGHISKIFDSKPLDIVHHRHFVQAVHRTLRTGKTDGANATDYLILNYDTLLEDALGLESIPYADGLEGGPMGWWNRESLNNGAAARVLKIHGSIDWCLLDNDKLPRRIRSGGALAAIKPKDKVLIWPAATKYRETQLDPYAQIADIVRRRLRPQEGSQVVLTICGYRFADSHINLEIDNALKESEGRLTVLVFTEMEKPEGQLNEWFKDPALSKQVRIHAKRGFFHDLTELTSTTDLPWWKFEVLVRLLKGER